MKRMFAILLILATACSTAPSPSVIQTAIAATAQAQPTPTVTPSPSATPTPLPTDTPTITPSPMPDLRIIDQDPQTFLLARSDLPPESRYYLPGPDWTAPDPNEKIISEWGISKGTKYVADTGRIAGYSVAYERGTKAIIVPEEVFCDVIKYKTTAGAKLSLTDYNDTKRAPADWKMTKEANQGIGDLSIEYKHTEITSGGDVRAWYDVEFTYRNLVAVTEGYGLQKEVDPSFVETEAKAVLSKLEQAPLSSP